MSSTADSDSKGVDTPFRDLGFSGVPNRLNVLRQPTTDCPVQLTEPPFMVPTLEEIEIVHLERVQFGLKNFDMVCIFKDLNRPPEHINTVPVESLEAVKDWLDSVNIPYSEGPLNLNWGTIMKTVIADPHQFFVDGGWSFLTMESDNATVMKAVHYEKPFQVSVREVPLPKIQHPDDAIIKVTTAAICGSDLHMYQGRTAAEAGLIFGHENMGIISEVGSGVTLLKKGDRVVLPFNVADGRCLNCEEGNTAFCTGVNPGFAGGAYGYVAMGPYAGGQVQTSGSGSAAQYLRIPFADFNALPLPPGTAHEASFALLADIFPTGWHGLTLSNFSPGESVAVFGAGPVGLMAAYSAFLRGASKIYVVDKVPERLAAAKKIAGCIPVDFSAGEDAVDVIIRENDGKMVDRSIDAVGYQAVGSGKEAGEVPNVVLEQCIKVTRPTGGIGVPGLYVPSDPGAVDEKSSQGMMLMSFGKLFEKGLTIGTGQCNVKKYNRYLRDMIISGRADPSFVVSHEIGIDEAPKAYEKFDKRVEGYTKVLIHPNGPL